MDDRPHICIYHANCIDGLAAAWAIWQRWKDIEFVPAKYGDAPPDVTDKHVLIVDFSYKADVLLGMATQAARITVLDHHKTAREGLQPLLDGKVIDGIFDMEHSGAWLAWEYAWFKRTPPRIIQSVQDRDLWKFEMEGTREIHAVLASQEPNFLDFSLVAKRLEDPHLRNLVVEEGAAILRAYNRNLQDVVGATYRLMSIGGHVVPVANVPYFMASDAGNLMSRGVPFAATYVDTKDATRQFSLRSQAEGADVSAIAQRYGGGGHVRAAGFTAPLGWEGDEVKEVPLKTSGSKIQTGNSNAS